MATLVAKLLFDLSKWNDTMMKKSWNATKIKYGTWCPSSWTGLSQMPDATKAMSNLQIVLDYRRYHDTFMDTYIHYPVLTQVAFTKYYCDMFTNL